MKNKHFLHLKLVIIVIIFVSCKANDNDEEKITVVNTKDISAMDIIRNPVDHGKLSDTINIAKITFEEKYFNFGTLFQGDKVKKSFKFTNSGKKPLLITRCSSTCGCTVPKWPKNYIEPGESGIVEVLFNSKGKLGKQKKKVTIISNAYPSNAYLYIEGNIEKK